MCVTFVVGNLKGRGRDHSEDIDIGRMIVLKLNLGKYSWRVSSRFISLIRTSGWLL
jgi:hypothetical protein